VWGRVIFIYLSERKKREGRKSKLTRLVFPFLSFSFSLAQVLRTRLRQPIPDGMLKPKYTGLLQTLKLVIAEEGARSLYGGLTAHLMRVVPNAAAMYSSVPSLSLFLSLFRVHSLTSLPPVFAVSTSSRSGGKKNTTRPTETKRVSTPPSLSAQPSHLLPSFASARFGIPHLF